MAVPAVKVTGGILAERAVLLIRPVGLLTFAVSGKKMA
jgi:hypothetical protein